MSELKFLKGNDVNLPSLDNREEGTFYVTTDSKKIVLGDAVWQDTETVKEEIKNIIIDNELTIAAALTRLHENKVDSSALTESLDAKQDLLESGVNIKTINGTSILGSGNIALDFSFYEVVSELPVSGINTNKIYVVPSANGGENNIHTEYMFVNDKWEIVGTYAASVDLTGYATEEWVGEQLSLMEDKIPSLEGYATESWVLDNNFALANDLEDLSGHVLDNEVVIAAALTDLEETKADKSEIPSLGGYATEEWVENQNFLTSVPGEYVTAQEMMDQNYATETFVNTAVGKKQDTLVSGTNIKTINGTSILGSGDIAIDLGLFELVTELPSETSDIDSNKIYLVQSTESGETNVYVEYMYVNNVWEKVGEYKAAIDLTPYALKTDVEAVDSRVTELSGGVLDNEVVIAAALTDLEDRKLDSSALTENLGAYALKSDMESADALLQENIDAEVTAREEAIAELVQEIEDNELITVQALTELRETKLDKTEVPSMEGYATEDWVTANFSQVEVDLSDYYTKSEVDAQLSNIDLSDYYTKSEVDAIATALSDEIQENETVAAKALTQLNDLKANIDEIPTFASQIKVLDENNVFDGVTIEDALNQLYQMIMNLQN